MHELLHRLLMSPLGLVGGYLFLLPLSITGIGALVAALFVGRGQKLRLKLWFLLPLFLSGLATALIPWLAMTVFNFGVTGTQLSTGWVAVFAGLELLTIGLAVLLNRSTLPVALLLALFTTTYAIAAFVVMGLDVMCWRGC